MGRLDGRIAIVTGGARSLGRAFAAALAGEGARVVIGDIADGAATAAAISAEAGTRCLYRRLDVADEASVKAFVEWVRDELGTPHVLVNNAARLPRPSSAPITACRPKSCAGSWTST